MSLRIAAAQFEVFAPADWNEYARRMDNSVSAAVTAGAQLLVYPEYASLVLAALDGKTHTDPREEVTVLQGYRDAYVDLHRTLAKRHRIYLLAGSFPWEVEPGVFNNRAWFFNPEGKADFQDKLIMTRFEREQWNISAGTQLKVFHTALGRIGVDICYDIEFPLLSRVQVAAGATLLLTPSCTDTLAGYHRVRIGAQARALENQCIVVQAPLVGSAPWSAAIDVNVGAAGIYGPPDRGFPDDGVLAIGRFNEGGWVYADVDLEAVQSVRSNGQVLNHRHWLEQAAPPLSTATVIHL